jgi:hypothetical protein
MKCILEEFADIQKAENFINQCLDNDSYIKGATVIPFAKSGYNTHYLVSVYKAEDEDKSGILGFNP